MARVKSITSNYCPCYPNVEPGCDPSGVPEINGSCGKPHYKFFAEQIQCPTQVAGGLEFKFRIGAQPLCELVSDTGYELAEPAVFNDWYTVLGIGQVQVGGIDVADSCVDPTVVSIQHFESGQAMDPNDLTVTNQGWVNEPVSREGSICTITSSGVQYYRGIIFPIAATTKETGIGYYYYSVVISDAALAGVGFKWGEKFNIEWSINARVFACNNSAQITQNDVEGSFTPFGSGGSVRPYPFTDPTEANTGGGVIVYPIDVIDTYTFGDSNAACCSVLETAQIEGCPGYDTEVLGPNDEIFLGSGDGDTCQTVGWNNGDMAGNYPRPNTDYIPTTQPFTFTDQTNAIAFKTSYITGTQVRTVDSHNGNLGQTYNLTYRLQNLSDYALYSECLEGGEGCCKISFSIQNQIGATSVVQIDNVEGYIGGVPVTLNPYNPVNGIDIPPGDFAEVNLLVTVNDPVLSFSLIAELHNDCECNIMPTLQGGYYSDRYELLSAPAIMCSETDAWDRTNHNNCWNVGVDVLYSGSVPPDCTCDEVQLTIDGGNTINSLNTPIGNTVSFEAITNCLDPKDCANVYLNTEYVPGMCYDPPLSPDTNFFWMIDSDGITIPLDPMWEIIPPPSGTLCSQFTWVINFTPTGTVDFTGYKIVIGFQLESGECCLKEFDLEVDATCTIDCEDPWLINEGKGAYIENKDQSEWELGAADTEFCVCKLDDTNWGIQLPSGQMWQAYQQLEFTNIATQAMAIEINRTNNCLGADAYWITLENTVLLPSPIGVDTPFQVEGTTVHTYGTVKLMPGETIYVNIYFNSYQLWRAGIDAPCGPSSSTIPPAMCDAITCDFDIRAHLLCSSDEDAPVEEWVEVCDKIVSPDLGLKCCDCPPNCGCEDGENVSSVQLEEGDPSSGDDVWGDLFSPISCCPSPSGSYCFIDKVEHLVYSLITEADANSKFNWNADKFDRVNDIFYLYLLLAILDWERYLAIQSIINQGTFDGTDPCDWELPSIMDSLDAGGLNEYSDKNCVLKYFKCMNIDITQLLECPGIFTDISFQPNQYEILGIEPPKSGINNMCIEECVESPEICPETQYIFKIK
tara:strand:+ start:34949 stop:38197 length:3249 start_codon:yes stop_codon:yes gene_type:complete